MINMCLTIADVKEYQSIVAKMSRAMPLSEKDERFLVTHNLNEKFMGYKSYLSALSILEQKNEEVRKLEESIKRSAVSS